MIRRILILSFVALVVAAAVAIGTVHTWVNATYDTSGEPVRFTVAQGDALSRVVNRLANENLLRHPRAITLYASLKGYDRSIKVGTYLVTPGESAASILDRMVTGDVYKVSVTIPEGLMHNEIAQTIAQHIDVDSLSIARAVVDTRLIEALGVDASSLEGYLFPDTYHFPWAASADDVVTTMVYSLGQVFDPEMDARAEEMGMSRHEVLTLASIIEAECRLHEEQTTVSSVYHNRLERGMRLEADPTVAYAKGMYRGRLFYKDLEIDSPYNTYRNAGLPPGPICSPGAGAIRAALYPDSTDALYFVARGDGGHVFSKTLKDHLTAVEAFRQRRNAQRAPSGR